MQNVRIRKVLLLLASLLLLSFGQGCVPHWTVVKQANPNPFVGQKKFLLEEVSWEGLMVKDKPETEFKAGRDAKENERWDGDKQKVTETILAALRGAKYEWVKEPGDDVVLVRTHVTNMHGGISMGIGSTAAHIDVTLQLVKGKDVADEITTFGEYSQGDSFKIGGISTGGYSGSDRLGKAAEKIGGYLVDYLDSRTKP